MGYKESDIKDGVENGKMYIVPNATQYETINIKNVDTIVVYEKDEDTAAMLEVELLHKFMLELDEENSLFLRALENRKNIERVSFETLEKLVATHLLQQQYAIRSHVYECL